MKKFLSVFLILILMCSMFIIPTHALNVTTATIEKAVKWAEATAADDSHGYSQYNRWGNPDYDCASFVISAFRSAGFDLSSAVHCGNMKQAFIDEGFEWIPSSKIDLSTSKYLKRGDILLNTTSHTEIYIGDNMQVGAHEGTYDDYDLNDPGDSTGREICPVKYSNGSRWEGILRYPTNPPVDVGTDFYAYIINNATEKYLTNDNRNVSVRSLLSEGNPSQVWKFERQEDGSYIIRTCFDSKVLNVSNRGTEPGTNVGVYNDTESDAKRWFIYGTEDNYKFKPRLCDLSLYVYRGTAESEDGTNVCLGTNSTKTTQKFRIVKLQEPSATYVECKAGTSTLPTALWWNFTLGTNLYDVKIYSADSETEELVKEINDIAETYCSVQLPVGEYKAVVYSKNTFAQTKSINTVGITVEKGEEVKIGDTNLDGEVSVLDATTIQRFMAKITELTEEQKIFSDTNRDGDVSVVDATMIQRFMAKLIDKF
ncbi:MAG: RICIN domain-containing protein [Ruminococcus sp.]|nr:RICIN domain-containing protein [Ruminococcus sp.]